MPSEQPPQCNISNRRFGAGSRDHGFSIVELMAVVSVLAILAAVSVPTFTEVVNSNRLAARTNDIMGMLQLGRLESVRRGRRVVACPSNDGAACASTDTWRGWIVFEDANSNIALDTGETVLLTESVPPPIDVVASSNISGGTGLIVFRPDGLMYAANGTTLLSGNLAVCHATSRPRENVRDISIVTSRVSVARRDGADDACAAPSNP